jgi:hypothetical protein
VHIPILRRSLEGHRFSVDRGFFDVLPLPAHGRGKIPSRPTLPSHLGSALADNEAILSCRLKLSFVTKIRAARR